MLNNDDNIVKKVCIELDITQKQLAKIIGVHERTPAQWSSKGNIPLIVENFINLLLINKKIEKENIEFKNFLKSFKELNDKYL